MSGELEQLQARLESEGAQANPSFYREEFNRFIDDYTPIVRDFMYDYIADQLRISSDERISGFVTGEFDYAECVSHPDAYRGRGWRVHGTIEDIEKAELDGARVGLKSPVYLGYFLTAEGKPIAFHLMAKPEILYLQSDPVEIEGIFIKMARLETRAGEVVDIPFLMAKRLRKFR